MERCADPLTQLPIDEAILDYLLYSAIKTLLVQIQLAISGVLEKDEQEMVELPLQLVDSFLVMFRCMHPDYHASPDLQFRLRLLRYTTLFANRFAPSHAVPTASASKAMRKRQRERAEGSPYHNRLPSDLDPTTLAVRLSPSLSETANNSDKRPLEACTVTASGSKAKTSGSPPLLDTLPDFIALSAAKVMLEARSITYFWMEIAAGYMSHAVMEQILVYGKPGLEPLQEAFAWGFDEDSTAEEGSDELQINAMFLGENGTIDGWDDLREAHIRALIPPRETSLQSHLEGLLAKDLSSTVFERHLLDFLWGLLDSQQKPLLVQVESGKIDGWTRRETEELKANMNFL